MIFPCCSWNVATPSTELHVQDPEPGQQGLDEVTHSATDRRGVSFDPCSQVPNSAAAKATEAQFPLLGQVEALQPFPTNDEEDKDRLYLKKGDLGRVREIDEDGDVLILFDKDASQPHWIFQVNFGKLKHVAEGGAEPKRRAMARKASVTKNAADKAATARLKADEVTINSDPAELRKRGHSCTALKGVGFAIPRLQEAGYEVIDLYDAGFTAKQCKDAGINARQMHKAGYEPADLKEAGYTIEELRNAGYRTTQLAQVGYRASRMPGFDDALTLREKGFSALHLKDAGYDAEELVRGGFTGVEIREAGFDVMDLHDIGFDIPKLKEVGFSKKELEDAGFDAEELAKGGF